MKGKKRIWLVAAAVLLMVIVLVLATMPRVTAVKNISFTAVNAQNCPELNDAYQQLLEEHGDDAVSGDIVHVVTVQNLWSSCQFYILPCYITNVGTIPTAGSPSWSASLYMLTACSNENSLAARLTTLQVRDYQLELTPGANTFLYSDCEVDHLDIFLGDPRRILLEKAVDCLDTPQIRTRYTVATGESAKEREEQTAATFLWSYSLYCCGRQICTYQDVEIHRDYIVNA